MNKSIISWLNGSSRSVSVIAYAVCITILSWTWTPAIVAVKASTGGGSSPGMSEERQLSNAIAKVDRTLKKLRQKLDRNEDGTLERNELNQLDNSIRQLDQTVTQKFDQLAQHIENRNLDPIIAQRHTDMVDTYRAEFDELVSYLASLDSTDAAVVSQAVDDAIDQLDQFQLERPHQPIVPGQFSNFTVEPDLNNQPLLTQADFQREGYFSNPNQLLAAVGEFTFDNLPGASNPAYLAESDEVNISDAIRAKAAELDHDPVKIYYWVRNNVEWLPTWGAIQDSDITLGSRRGNAIDISSLLIALYRASGIPSRYVHGAIEVPVEEFKNWAGNFSDTQAALSFASSGGIPLQLFTHSDGTQVVQMEHIWVEAALDYFPSRVEINKDADSWISLEASFKQYEQIPEIDVVAAAGLDIDQKNQNFINSGTLGGNGDWLQNPEVAELLAGVRQAEANVVDFIENLQDPTILDILGGRQKIIEESPVLEPQMQTRALFIGPRYALIPDSLAPSITFAFSTDILGDPINPITFRWAKLNNKKVTLSFRPATDADSEALRSLIPDAAIGPADLPTSIPSYLLRVLPELKVDGAVVKVGHSRVLGEELLFYNKITEPNRPVQVDQRSIIIGSYVSFAVIGGSVSPQAIFDTKQHIEDFKTAVDSHDFSQVEGFSREDFVGNLYHAGLLGYFAQYSFIGTMLMRLRDGAFGLPLSAGTFGYEPNVSMFFGMPRAIEEGWANMDLHRVARNYSLPGANSDEKIGIGLAFGSLSSALENAIPEQIFKDETQNPDEGVSAVTALRDALVGGQKIYSLNASNISTYLSEIETDSGTKQEILSYVNAGYEATVHQHPVSTTNWSGTGYILSNPNTSEASYKISGGKNGDIQPTDSWLISLFLYVDSEWIAPYFEFTIFGKILAGLAAFLTGVIAFGELFESCGPTVALLFAGLIGALAWMLSGAAFFLVLGLMLSIWWTTLALIVSAFIVDLLIEGMIGFSGSLCILFSFYLLRSHYEHAKQFVQTTLWGTKKEGRIQLEELHSHFRSFFGNFDAGNDSRLAAFS